MCGRVCGAPCEAACRRGSIDQPIAIRALKRFVADQFAGPARDPQSFAQGECDGVDEMATLARFLAAREYRKPQGLRVAIIGSGPAGLAAGHDLALMGMAPTIFEAEPRPAGMLYTGIPAYRLPRDLIDAEIELIRSLGVEFRCGVKIGRDIDFAALREELPSLYIDLFEAGMPQPRCPLLESAWLLNRPAGDVVLENKLFYQNFGLEIHSQAAPDHLLTQLEFLAWLDHCLAAGNPDAASLERARTEVLQRHLAHWIRPLANLARNADGDCYADLLDALSLEIESALA